MIRNIYKRTKQSKFSPTGGVRGGSIIGAIGLGFLLMSCDAHDNHEPLVDTSMHCGDIVCSDGSVVRYDDYKKNEKTATAVVFYTNSDGKGQGRGYAVCLNDIRDVAFTDSIGISQNTSCSTTDYDGSSNTFALYNNKVHSPLAHAVHEYLVYGQRAYIPSVAQMQMLYAMKDVINPYLEKCGGSVLPDTPNGWYRTSTEVENQSAYMAWLFSLTSGAMQETSKLQEHRIRPIITIW